jgi:hypothetical protein
MRLAVNRISLDGIVVHGSVAVVYAAALFIATWAELAASIPWSRGMSETSG